MTPGTTWVYNATIRGDFAKPDVVRHVKTTMRVEEYQRVGRYEVAQISGGPRDVACFAIEHPTIDYWVRDGSRFYEISRSGPDLLDDPTEESIAAALEDSDPLVIWPMKGRKSIGCQKDSAMYCWTIEEGDDEFVLTFRTNPDHEIIHFKPNVGITRYVYGHHGSPCDIDVKLVKMRR